MTELYFSKEMPMLTTITRHPKMTHTQSYLCLVSCDFYTSPIYHVS